MLKRITTQSITRIAMVAALYVTLTWLLSAISYDSVQLRLAEVLILLAFYRREYGIGVIIGCFIANLNSPMLVYDLTLGVVSTIIPVILIWHTKKLSIAALWPVIFVGTIVGLELYLAFGMPLAIAMLQVAIGEAIVMVIGYILFKKLERNKPFLRAIGAEKEQYPLESPTRLVGSLSLVASMILFAIFVSLPVLYDSNGMEVTFLEMLKTDKDYYLGLVIMLIPLISGGLVFVPIYKKLTIILSTLLLCVPVIYLSFLPISLTSAYVYLILIMLLMLHIFSLFQLFSSKNEIKCT